GADSTCKHAPEGAQKKSEACFRVIRLQMTSTINDREMASFHVDMQQNSSMTTPTNADTNEPPTIAPSTHSSNVANQPPPCSPGVIALAIAPAISPRTIQPMKPIMTP